jgi:hypothetical protein
LQPYTLFLQVARADVPTVANADNTGAPGSSQTCGSCHTGGSYGTVTASIQIFAAGTNTPVSAYVGGTTYDMKVTITASSGTPVGYGFQMTCLTTPGNAPVAAANTYTNLASNVKEKTGGIGVLQWQTFCGAQQRNEQQYFCLQLDSTRSRHRECKVLCIGQCCEWCQWR